MKRIYLILISLLITTLNYAQKEGKYDYLDVEEEFNYQGVTLEGWINDSTPASAIDGANGLSKDGDDIKLGGSALEEDVTIEGAGYDIAIGTGVSKAGSIEINSNADLEILVDDLIYFESNGITWTFNGLYWKTSTDTLQDGNAVNAKITAALPYAPFVYEYTYSATITDSRPGVGYFRLNNATYASVTQIFIDNFDLNSVDKSDYLSIPDTGTYVSITDGTNYINYQLTGALTAASSYYKYGVTYINHSGVITGNCDISMDLSNNSGAAAADSLYHEYSSTWLSNGDTIPTQDTSTYSDTATYALNAPSDSLYHVDSQVWLSNGDSIPKDDSTHEVITVTDTLKSKLIYDGDSVIITSGVSEYKFIDDTAQLGTNNIKLKNLYATDNVQADTHKFGTNNYMIDAPQNNILEWNIANSYYRPFTSETDGVIYSGAVDPDFGNSARANFAGGWGVSKLYTSFINITEAGEDGDGLYYKAETDPRLEFTASGTEVYTYLKLPGISSPFYLYYNSSSNDSEINFELNTAGDNKISLQTNNLKTQNYNNEFQIIKTSAPSDTIVRVTLDSIILNKPVSIETTLSIGDSLQYPDGSWTTGPFDAQTAIETMEFDSLQVDKIVGATTSDSVTVDADLYVNGRVIVSDRYEAFAYEDPDSTITTSLTTSWIFLGSGGNNKFTNALDIGFSFDGDTLYFVPDADDYRDSVKFTVNYGGQSATSSINKSVYMGIFIKNDGGSVYTEYRPATKVSRTNTASVYYPGPDCTPSPIWLKDGDKIQIQTKCAATTTTLSVKNFGIRLKED